MRAEAALHYMTRFWQGKARRLGIWAAQVTWQLDLRPWGRTPKFRADGVSPELQANWIILKSEMEKTKPGQLLHLPGARERLPKVFPKISSLGQAASRGPKRVSVILGGNSSQPPDLKHYLTFRRWFPRSVVPLDFCVLTSWPMACPYPLVFAPLKCWFFIFRHFRILDQTINEPTNVSERYKSLRAENKVRGHRLSSQGPFWCVLAGWGHCYCP